MAPNLIHDHVSLNLIYVLKWHVSVSVTSNVYTKGKWFTLTHKCKSFTLIRDLHNIYMPIKTYMHNISYVIKGDETRLKITMNLWNFHIIC